MFTIFTHHAKTTDNLVKSLRNNLLKTGEFNNEKIAEQQVADVVNFDIHLTKDISGHRYIERITEIIPVENADYPEITSENGENDIKEFLSITREFYQRMTDRKIFVTKDIVIYENGSYKAVSKPSIRQISEIIKNLTNEEKIEFDKYLNDCFSGSESA